jgi:hypothetical protein
MLGVLLAHRGGSLCEVAAAAVDVLLGDGLGPLPVRRALRAMVPSDWTLKTSRAVDDKVRARVAEELAARGDVRRGDHALMAFVVAHAVEQVVECAVLSAPELLTSEGFRAELVALVVRYLSPLEQETVSNVPKR